MRKEKRAIKDKAKVEALLRRCQTLQLGLWDGAEPYVVTVNFGDTPFHLSEKDSIPALGMRVDSKDTGNADSPFTPRPN